MTGAASVATCLGSLDLDGRSTGRCCVTGCGEPGPYAALYDDGVLREHLRCVTHAAQDREDQAAGFGYLVAMKAVRVTANAD